MSTYIADSVLFLDQQSRFADQRGDQFLSKGLTAVRMELQDNRAEVERLQSVIDARDKAAGFEEVPALSPEAQQAFRSAVQEIDGVNLREVERLRGLLREARGYLDGSEARAQLAEAVALLNRWHDAYHKAWHDVAFEEPADNQLECCDDDTTSLLHKLGTPAYHTCSAPGCIRDDEDHARAGDGELTKKHTPACSYWDGLMAQVCNCGADAARAGDTGEKP
jgi:hypothetical protein